MSTKEQRAKQREWTRRHREKKRAAQAEEQTSGEREPIEVTDLKEEIRFTKDSMRRAFLEKELKLLRLELANPDAWMKQLGLDKHVERDGEDN
jgi:hypothetical protein